MQDKLSSFLAEWNNSADTILVHTSGSTGKPKAMWAEKQRMLNSARITCDFLGLKAGDHALLCMPLDYIAGKMMVVRCLERNMHLHTVQPSNHPLAEVDYNIDFVAMVPSQVYCSLQQPQERERLLRARNIIIGGGAVSKALEKELSTFPNAVWSSYGMTETLSHIALRRLSGAEASEWYTPFDGVRVSLNADDCLVIDAPAVCSAPLITNDIAEIASDGRRFRIRGRRDNVICSGGIKLQIEEMEEHLRPYIHSPFAITKRPDEKFGEVVVLVVEGAEKEKSALQDICRNALDRFSQPKKYIFVDRIPLTETGKVQRKTLSTLAEEVE